MTYNLREHTADIAVEARADSLGDVFASVADGLAAAMCDSWPSVGERFSFTTRSESLEAALYDYLDQLIYERDTRNVLPVANRATVQRQGGVWIVRASARGVPLNRVEAREVKAVTYSDMTIERQDGWHAYVVFDV
ncbi:MAG: archease [Halobacteriaceae archaeon]